MKMTGEERIAAPIDAVWAALNDPDVLRACIPGCQSLEPMGDDGFQAAATIKIGPISARFGGVVRLFDLDPPRGYRISGEGSGGAAGAAKGGALVRLDEDGTGTVLRYDVTADVSGRLAQLGGKLIDITAKQLAGVFFTRFSQEVEQRQAVASAGAPETTIAHEAPPHVDVPIANIAARSVPAPVQSVEHGGISGMSCLLIALATFVCGFVLGRVATGWDANGGLAGAAVGLLVVLVACAFFLLGQRRAGTISLDDNSIARLASVIERQQR